MSTQEEFEKAAESAKKLTNVGNEDLLSLYGLYKQATVGDCNTDKPGFFDMKGQAKWTAWDSRRGTDKEKAMKRYIRLVEKLSK